MASQDPRTGATQRGQRVPLQRVRIDQTATRRPMEQAYELDERELQAAPRRVRGQVHQQAVEPCDGNAYHHKESEYKLRHGDRPNNRIMAQT
jgi:hypothetical protein